MGVFIGTLIPKPMGVIHWYSDTQPMGVFIGMEDLTRSWQKLSLAKKEGVNVDLTESRKAHGFALATKFFSRRSLNIDAVVRTFSPLWRTKGSFQASDAKQNYMVFTFDQEEDVEKVLMGEPCSFDRHLVVFHKYDGLTPLQEICFDRVSLNILDPIYRGRQVTFGQNSDGWVSFTYERLLNICYWCGRFTHDDKECLVWLKSKGSIAVEDQQFGAWLRAPQFNPARLSYVEVKGFEKEETSRRVTVDKPDSMGVAPGTSSAAKLVGNDLDKETPDISKRDGRTKSLADFVATLQDIDDEIQRFSNSNHSSVMLIKGIEKTDAEIKGVERSTKISDHAIKDTVTQDMFVDGKATKLNSVELLELNFEMG
ncbi:hypothetical protein SO802_015213 [Lithocarpus litseifolius]|uniref:DUF4283 domain-containing protein n=1 Tax=Lithocarpus litseifolius TaxID=425828 RepID=A0AAW2CT17_9ROSI